MTDDSHIVTFRHHDGKTREVEMTTAQVLDIDAGINTTWTIHDERVLVDDDGQITFHESAVPQQRDEAA